MGLLWMPLNGYKDSSITSLKIVSFCSSQPIPMSIIHTKKTPYDFQVQEQVSLEREMDFNIDILPDNCPILFRHKEWHHQS